MATLALLDATVFVEGYDFTSDLNEVGLDVSFEELDDTTFGDDSRSRIAGLGDVEMTMNGWWQSETSNPVDLQAAANFATSAVATVSPDGTDGSLAYFARRLSAMYSMGGKIGEVMPFNVSAKGSDGIGAVRGQLLLPKTTVTGDSNGTGVQLGAVASTQSLYTAIHVLSAGTTADVIVESDDNGSFTSATTRSSTTVIAQGGTWVTAVAGAITDDYWRVRTANVTGTFSIAVAVGIR